MGAARRSAGQASGAGRGRGSAAARRRFKGATARSERAGAWHPAPELPLVAIVRIAHFLLEKPQQQPNGEREYQDIPNQRFEIDRITSLKGEGGSRLKEREARPAKGAVNAGVAVEEAKGCEHTTDCNGNGDSRPHITRAATRPVFRNP